MALEQQTLHDERALIIIATLGLTRQTYNCSKQQAMDGSTIFYDHGDETPSGLVVT